jgi:putative hydrolase of the HAD superfamily
MMPIRRAAARNVTMLNDLRRRGFVLGVISNACGNAQALCDDLGYSPCLSLVVDSRIVGVAKPDPRIYQLALDRVGIAAPASMMVGDSYERDVVPAHQVGMRTAWLTPDAAAATPGVADIRIASLGDLAAHVAPVERAQA